MNTNGRIGYVLTEEETEKVYLLADYLDIEPSMFFSHCINIMWSRLNG